jgi:SAM-dependent methyltransferase
MQVIVPRLSSAPCKRPLVKCAACESAAYSVYLQGGGYDIVQCRKCRLRYVNPQPTEEELRDFYAAFDRESEWRGEAEEAFDRSIRDLVLRFRPQGSVLDVGSSRGNFLLAMRRAGFAVQGVEPSEKNSEFARSCHHIPTCTATVEQFLNAPGGGQFGLITLLNVLEHLRDPHRVLLGLRARLAEGGLLLAVVPDARMHDMIGRARRKLGFADPFWMNSPARPMVGFDPPNHLYSFEPSTLRRLVESCGFRTLLLRNAPVILRGAGWKNAAKRICHASSEFLYCVSFGRVVAGYSTLIAAQKLA